MIAVGCRHRKSARWSDLRYNDDDDMNWQKVCINVIMIILNSISKGEEDIVLERPR